MINKLIIKGVIGKDVLSDDVIARLESFTGDVDMFVDSNGGSLFQGIQIHNAMREYNRGKINVLVGSIAASIASYFIMAADKIRVYDNSSVMVHNALVMNLDGNAQKLRQVANTLDGATNLMYQAYIARTGKSLEEIKALCDKETYIFGSDIVSNGFADEIVISKEEINAEVSIKAAKDNLSKCMGECELDYSGELDNIAAIVQSSNEKTEFYNEALKILKEVEK